MNRDKNGQKILTLKIRLRVFDCDLTMLRREIDFTLEHVLDSDLKVIGLEKRMAC